MASSPRRALLTRPARMRWLIRYNSASDIVPFSPSSSRSLYSVGSYTPSASASRHPPSAHSSSSWYQSFPERARRDISVPSTRPTCPNEISATRRWKPTRCSALDPDLPRSSSINTTREASHPSATALSTSAYCSRVDSWWPTTCSAFWLWAASLRRAITASQYTATRRRASGTAAHTSHSSKPALWGRRPLPRPTRRRTSRPRGHLPQPFHRGDHAEQAPPPHQRLLPRLLLPTHRRSLHNGSRIVCIGSATSPST